MNLPPSRAVIFASLALGLAACVPTTQTPVTAVVVAPPVIETPPLEPVNEMYLAMTDGKYNLPAIPTAKVPAEFQRQVVDYATTEAPGTIIINPSAKHLYFVTGDNKAIRYGIAVGKAGFQWSGEALVTGRRNWPTWTPPKEMIERNPKLEKWAKGQPGGLDNPLGARALYLTTGGVDYGYRIHGTPDWWSIGKNASSGCIRMINQDVIDLFNRVPSGAKVIVMTASGEMPKGLTLPPPSPKKAKPAAKPAPKPEDAVAPATTPEAVPAVTAPSTTTPGTTTPAVTAPEVTAPATAPAVTTPSTIAPAPLVVPKSVDAPLGTPSALQAPAAPAVILPVLPAPAVPAAAPAAAPVVTAPAAPASATVLFPAPQKSDLGTN